MAQPFLLAGSYGTVAGCAAPVGAPSLIAPFNIDLFLSQQSWQTVDLISDAPTSVTFPTGLVLAALIILVPSYKVRARVSSADGAQQAIPSDAFTVLVSQSVPFTALDLTRLPGTDTTVNVFIGQLA